MRFLALALALVALVFATGCARVPGFADDVELTYESEEALTGAAFGEDLRALVLRRLGAAQIAADVTLEPAGKRVKIVVDEGQAPLVDELVTWTGTLQFYEPDPAYDAPPPDGGRDRLTPGAAGGERFWRGAHADVLRAAEEWSVDAAHRVLVEPLWDTARGTSSPAYRTRIVRSSPITELGDGTRVGWGEGGTLRLRATTGTSAEGAMAAARSHGAILARGHTSLGVPTFEGDALLLSFGEGFTSYSHAQEEKHLLTTPRLPAVKRAGAVGLPPNTVLASACVVLPLLLSFGWLFFVRRFDRAHPEPMWLVLVTFGLGAASTFPAALIELAMTRLSPWLDPRLATFGGQVFALPFAFVVFTAVVGLAEESAKLLAASFAARRPEFDEPVDGIIYGIVASLGFAAAENVPFFAIGRLTAPLVIARSFMSVPAHMFFGAIWGYCLGRRLVDRRAPLFLWLLLAAAGHGLFDALLSTEGTGALAIVLNVALASVFIVLVRRALRHGVVEAAMLTIRPEERLLFRVGRPFLFWSSSVLLHVFAFGIFVLGAWYQLARHRPELAFVVSSSVLLVLFGAAAVGIAHALPLDVAIDDYGVTFGGAARPWRKIRGYARREHHVDLDCEAGPLVLGPAPKGVLDAIDDALRERLGGGGVTRATTLESATLR